MNTKYLLKTFAAIALLCLCAACRHNPKTDVSLTPAQVREATKPIAAYQDSVYKANSAQLARELSAINTKLERLQGDYNDFSNQQNTRNEKYNRALTTTDAELYSFFADRYGR